jgi:hypothetical protein
MKVFNLSVGKKEGLGWYDKKALTDAEVHDTVWTMFIFVIILVGAFVFVYIPTKRDRFKIEDYNKSRTYKLILVNKIDNTNIGTLGSYKIVGVGDRCYTLSTEGLGNKIQMSKRDINLIDSSVMNRSDTFECPYNGIVLDVVMVFTLAFILFSVILMWSIITSEFGRNLGLFVLSTVIILVGNFMLCDYYKIIQP